MMLSNRQWYAICAGAFAIILAITIAAPLFKPAKDQARFPIEAMR